ncbi:putative reverse transcriptase domain-containing protein [Tanacetum coccineum]
MKETPYELLKDVENKQLGKNKEVKMTIYNALPHKEYEHVFMCKTAKEVWHTLIITQQGNSQVKNYKIDLLTQEYESFKSLDPDYSSKNHVRKFLRALPLKWRSKMTLIEEAKDLATLHLDELIGNLKVYEMVLDNDGVASKATKEKAKSLALKAKVTREQTSDNSTCQDESDKDEEINLMAINFKKFPRKGVKVHDKFDICQVKCKGGESSRRERECYNCSSKNHRASKCPKPNNKAFAGVTWSDSEDDDEPRNDTTCLMAIDSQEVHLNPFLSNIINMQKENEELLKFSKDFSETYKKLLQEKRILEKECSKLSSKVNELELEVKKLGNNKKVIEPCKKCIELTQEVYSLKRYVSKLQNESLEFSKFKKSSIDLDDMLSHQKFSQDKEGLGFSKIDKTTSIRYSQTSKAYIVLNKETLKVEELINFTFDEILPRSRTSPLVDDDMIKEQAVQNHDRTQNPNEPKNIKEAIKDECWTMAMQEELDQFVRNDVWDLVPCPKDHVGDVVDRKSTSGICTFVRSKQTSLANSITESDYVAAKRACQKALWMKQAFVDYNITLNEVPILLLAKSEIWDKIKEPLSPRLNKDEYSIFCENTTHMMNALKKVRMESREMLLSIHHSLKMLLDIISKMNRKLEDKKIKRNDKGKEKVNDF